jgi:alanyl-tRNA synthetase
LIERNCAGAAADGRANLLAMVTNDLTDRVQAGSLIKQMTGGKGGGRPTWREAAG